MEDRLYKIRHSLNIDGVFRSLALFQPPIDPGALVQAVAAGAGAGLLGSAIAALNISVPHYRFSFMLEKAKEMTGNVLSLGSALQSALESKDAEELTLLQHTHELNILNQMTEVKQYQIEEARASLAALEDSLASAEARVTRYTNLINTGLIGKEQTQIDLMIAATVLKGVASVAKIIAGATGGIPDIEVGGSGFGGSPVATVTAGGKQISTVFDIGSQVLELAAGILDGTAAILGIQAGYERRKAEWEFEQLVAGHEVEAIKDQIAAAAIQINIATRELQIHETTIEQHKEVGDFYKQKFSNKALYNWLSGRLTTLYFQTYKLAFDMAKQAERAYQYEFGATDTYISFGHWDSRRKGLLAGEGLMLELNRLEKSALDQDSRYLERSKRVFLWSGSIRWPSCN